MNKVYWVASVNLTGLYDTKPIKCAVWCPDLQVFYDRSGNVEVDPKKIGLQIRPGIIRFISPRKSDVILWLSGANSVMKMMREWVN